MDPGAERAGTIRLRVAARPIALILLALFTSGCASLWPGGFPHFPGSSVRSRPVPPFRVVREDAPADYDVLVAELAQIEADFALSQEAYERAAEKDPGSAFIQDRLARLAWQLDDFGGAVRHAERALELAPEDVGVRLFLGRLYRMRRDFDGLDRVLRDSEGRPIDADSAYALFRVALERSDFMQAENLARQLAEMEPDQLRGLLGLASVYEKRGDYKSAEDVVRRGLEEFPDHFLLYMRLAQIERSQGDRDGEIAVYREVLESHPGHYGILQRLAQAQLDDMDIDGALVTFGVIVDAYPEDLVSLQRLASLEFSAGRYQSAANRLEAVLDRDPNQPELAIVLGQNLRAAGDDAGAIEAFERVQPKHPNYFDARFQILLLLESQERFDEALVEIDRLRKLRPDRQLEFRAATLRIQQGDFEGGVALLEDLLNGSEEDIEVFYQLGMQYGLQGDADESLHYMQRVLELDLDNANALNFIGYSWAERGENLDEAEKLIRRAIALSPDDGYITDSLGWVYYKMAEDLFEASRKEEALRLLEQAQEHLVQAAELTGGDSVVSEHLGDVLLLRGEKAGALDYYEEAADQGVRESEQPQLLEKRDRLRRDLGRGSVPQPTGYVERTPQGGAGQSEAP